MDQVNILFIGGGNISYAQIKGLCNNHVNPSTIYVLEKSAERCHFLNQEFGIHATTQANHELFDKVDIIVFAVKPQSIPDVLTDYKPFIKRSLIISVLAGVSIHYFEQNLSETLAIVRALPNTASAVQQGVTGLFGNAKVNSIYKEQADFLFKSVGTTVWVKHEAELETITGISGCGPAYFYTFFEAMVDKAVALGMAPDLARQLTLATAQGAVKMAEASTEPLATLSSQVASKGGATAAALNYFEQHHFKEIVQHAMDQAINRARALGALYE